MFNRFVLCGLCGFCFVWLISWFFAWFVWLVFWGFCCLFFFGWLFFCLVCFVDVSPLVWNLSSNSAKKVQKEKVKALLSSHRIQIILLYYRIKEILFEYRNLDLFFLQNLNHISKFR